MACLPVTLGLSKDRIAVGVHLSNIVFVIPHITVALFTWNVFRPKVAWARALAIVLCVGAVLLMLVGYALTARHGTEAFRTSVEALLYYGSARKRAAIGLMDPLVANRFLLWAVWSLR